MCFVGCRRASGGECATHSGAFGGLGRVCGLGHCFAVSVGRVMGWLPMLWGVARVPAGLAAACAAWLGRRALGEVRAARRNAGYQYTTAEVVNVGEILILELQTYYYCSFFSQGHFDLLLLLLWCLLLTSGVYGHSAARCGPSLALSVHTSTGSFARTSNLRTKAPLTDGRDPEPPPVFSQRPSGSLRSRAQIRRFW